MLRRHKPAIIARVVQDELVLDLRTVFEDQEDEIARAFEQIT
jgi:seryl-tRNA(Sec) selenium transferase